jgi:hypothetical protein
MKSKMVVILPRPRKNRRSFFAFEPDLDVRLTVKVNALMENANA